MRLSNYGFAVYKETRIVALNGYTSVYNIYCFNSPISSNIIENLGFVAWISLHWCAQWIIDIKPSWYPSLDSHISIDTVRDNDIRKQIISTLIFNSHKLFLGQSADLIILSAKRELEKLNNEIK